LRDKPANLLHRVQERGAGEGSSKRTQPLDVVCPAVTSASSSSTCTDVSFAHGSDDGQKGMGLIMLILIGVVPTAFALNRTPDIKAALHRRASRHRRYPSFSPTG